MANYIASYNRSGNTWLRFLVEYVSKLPTTGHSDISIAERLQKKGGHALDDVDITRQPIAVKRHVFAEGELKPEDRFVLILRDPTECIWNSMGLKYNLFIKEFFKYRELIRLYDEHPGEKIIIYYENLIKFPIQYGVHVTNFFGDIATYGFGPVDLDYLKEQSYLVYDNPIYTKDKISEPLHRLSVNYIKEVYKLYETKYIDNYT